jgi:acyl carrier protein phosphodiesterase
MNYLAHLHIARQVESSLLGNLLGDFVKGQPSPHFSKAIQHGIFLHRRVDGFTDSHPVSRQLKGYFVPSVRRYVPIALDMFWDHCLANQWSTYDSSPLAIFVADAQSRIEQESRSVELPLGFISVSQKLWSQQWLLSYQSFDNIAYALERISQRRPQLIGLVQCISGLEQYYDVFSDAFNGFYPEIMAEAQRFQSRLVS